MAAEPLVRVQVMTPPPIVVGQQVEIAVDVLAPNYFMSPPKFPQIDFPNAIVTLQDGAQNLVETIGDTTYAGIRRSYLVTPQVAGEFALPETRITFTYAAVPGQGTNGSVTLPRTKFTVTGPPGTSSGSIAAVATKLTVSQTLDRDPKGLKAGDTLVRTITITAAGMQAMMIPEADFAAPEGIRIYPQDPVLSNATSGLGDVEGKRIDRATYAFEKAGDYALPSVEISWYDPATRKRETATAPAIDVTVSEQTAFQSPIAPPQPAPPVSADPSRWKLALLRTIGALLALALLAWACRAVWPRVRAWWTRWQDEREHSESAYFGKFEAACRSGNRLVIYAALDAWSRRADISRLDVWLREFGVEGADRELERFERATFGPLDDQAGWQPRGLLNATSEARRNWLRKRRGATGKQVAALPALNP
ncbi:hypothetical protein [Pseudaminobacter soli (ex Li et al. 2025)]|uniref:BatD family protein n=1 Tax=Pseudaminobacter soli (ex Li et al. 2025) TaxID=1295366 RepID=UPI002475DF5C|nr:hypothetical protein [Mesorhizobium soli]